MLLSSVHFSTVRFGGIIEEMRTALVMTDFNARKLNILKDLNQLIQDDTLCFMMGKISKLDFFLFYVDFQVGLMFL